jgi:hypothetical protein
VLKKIDGPVRTITLSHQFTNWAFSANYGFALTIITIKVMEKILKGGREGSGEKKKRKN